MLGWYVFGLVILAILGAVALVALIYYISVIDMYYALVSLLFLVAFALLFTRVLIGYRQIVAFWQGVRTEIVVFDSAGISDKGYTWVFEMLDGRILVSSDELATPFEHSQITAIEEKALIDRTLTETLNSTETKIVSTRTIGFANGRIDFSRINVTVNRSWCNLSQAERRYLANGLVFTDEAFRIVKPNRLDLPPRSVYVYDWNGRIIAKLIPTSPYTWDYIDP